MNNTTPYERTGNWNHAKDHPDKHHGDPFTLDKNALQDNIISQLRTHRDYYGPWFFDKIVVSIVVGKSNWIRVRKTERFSNLVTVSDEAFALLVLENGYAYWLDKFKKYGTGSKINDEFKYTKRENQGSQTKGWTKDGIDRYNVLCKLVKEDRDKTGNEEFDRFFYEAMMNRYGSNTERKRKVTNIRYDDEVYFEDFGKDPWTVEK